MHPIQRHSSRAAADGTGSNGRKLDYRGAAVIQALPRYTAEGWKDGRTEGRKQGREGEPLITQTELRLKMIQAWLKCRTNAISRVSIMGRKSKHWVKRETFNESRSKKKQNST